MVWGFHAGVPAGPDDGQPCWRNAPVGAFGQQGLVRENLVVIGVGWAWRRWTAHGALLTWRMNNTRWGCAAAAQARLVPDGRGRRLLRLLLRWRLRLLLLLLLLLLLVGWVKWRQRPTTVSTYHMLRRLARFQGLLTIATLKKQKGSNQTSSIAFTPFTFSKKNFKAWWCMCKKVYARCAKKGTFFYWSNERHTILTWKLACLAE